MGQKAKQEKRKSLELRAASRRDEGRVGRSAKFSSASGAESFPEKDQSTLPIVEGITMDKAGTILMDDGFSVRRVAKGWRVQVSIVDMPFLIPDGSRMEEEASFLRQESRIDDKNIQRIFPYNLLRGRASFQPGMKSRAITFDILLDNNLNVINSSIYHSMFKNRCSYAFNTVDEDVSLGKTPELVELLSFGQSLRQKRIADAVFSAQTKLHIDLPSASESLADTEIPNAKQLVNEVLYLANGVAADTLTKNKIDAPFRRRPPEIHATHVSSHYDFDRQVNALAMDVADSMMGPVNANIRVTAPMRAYNEFLGLKVIAAHLDHRPVSEFSARMVKSLSAEFRKEAMQKPDVLGPSWKGQWQYALDRQQSKGCVLLPARMNAGVYQDLSRDCTNAGLPVPVLSMRKVSTSSLTLYLAAFKPVNDADRPVCGVADRPSNALVIAACQFRRQL